MSEQPSRYSSGSVALGRGGGTVTLVEQTSFCLSGHDGDILPGGADGIFVGDTRVLSRLELRVGGRRPEPVSVAREGEDEAVIALRTPLPEPFCRLSRGDVERAVAYPTSCSPQAWSSAAPLLVLRTLPGFSPDVPAGRLAVDPIPLDGVG